MIKTIWIIQGKEIKLLKQLTDKTIDKNNLIKYLIQELKRNNVLLQEKNKLMDNIIAMLDEKFSSKIEHT